MENTQATQPSGEQAAPQPGQLDFILTNLCVTAIGKALVKKGVLTQDEIISELTVIQDSLKKQDNPGLAPLVTGIGDCINGIKSWG